MNRERAGVHYPSDTEAGKFIADKCVELIESDCPRIRDDLIAKAKAEYLEAAKPTPLTADAQLP